MYVVVFPLSRAPSFIFLLWRCDGPSMWTRTLYDEPAMLNQHLLTYQLMPRPLQVSLWGTKKKTDYKTGRSSDMFDRFGVFAVSWKSTSNASVVLVQIVMWIPLWVCAASPSIPRSLYFVLWLTFVALSSLLAKRMWKLFVSLVYVEDVLSCLTPKLHSIFGLWPLRKKNRIQDSFVTNCVFTVCY